MILRLFLLVLFVNIGVSFGSGIVRVSLNLQDPNQPNHATTGLLAYPNSGNRTDTWPVIVFSPGWIGSNKAYDYIIEALVPAGYIVIVESSYDYTPFSTPTWKALDQTYLLKWTRDQNANSSSPLFSRVGTTAAAMGHSEGGAASWVSNYPSLLKHDYGVAFDTLISLSGCFTLDGQQKDYLSGIDMGHLPALIVAATGDCVCVPSNQEHYYNAHQTKCKLIVNLKNGTHCRWTSGKSPAVYLCEVAEAALGCGPLAPHITFAEQQQRTLAFAMPWLNWRLKGNQQAKVDLLAALKSYSPVTSTRFDCPESAL